MDYVEYVADEDSWAPWELLHDGNAFLGERFVIGRWPHELGTAQPYEIPLGPVSMAYYYGVEYAPKDLRLGLVQASQNKIGNLVDAVLLYCYHYNPESGKYGAVIMNILRLSAAGTMVFLGAGIILMLRRDTGHGAPGERT